MPENSDEMRQPPLLDSEEQTTQWIKKEEAESIYRELYSTMMKTIGPWSTKKILGEGMEGFDPEKPIESIQNAINNLAKMVGIRTAKRITLLAMTSLRGKK